MCEIEVIWRNFKQKQHSSVEYAQFIQNNMDKMSVVPAIYADVLYHQAKALLKESSDIEGSIKVLNILKSYLHTYIRHQETKQLPIYAFSFRACTEYAFDDLRNVTCSLVHPSYFNDPIDPLLINWLNMKIRINQDENLYPLLLKATNHIRMRCFVTVKGNNIKNLNPLMWAHYADSHQGFCVKYRIDSKVFINTNNCSMSVHHVQYKLPKSINQIKLEEALYAKQAIWKYENELRLIAYDLDLSSINDIKLVHGLVIDSLYIGCKCTEVNKNKLINIFRASAIPIYQMMVDVRNPMKYTYIRIA